MTDVTLLYVHGCPSWPITGARLHALADELGPTLQRVDTPGARVA